MSMIINRFVNSFVFWAAWIIIPVIMEIIPSIGSIVVLIKKKIKPVKYDIPIIYPEISLLIPVYNSQDSLEACISSIYESDYPNDKIRIFLVNNQGQDNSFNVFAECQKKFPELMMQWLNAKQGKSKALNLALFNSDGKYIIHIDSDGILEKTALTNMVNKFEADLSIDCMTGAIMTMPDQVEEYKGFFAKLLRKMEFMEYAQAFLAGRNYASELNAIYTLSGAFSAFRKSTVLKSQLYNTDTICEDTQITFQMKYLQKKRVYMCENAIFYVDPIEDMNKLYTQRQRWQRGSLEVSHLFLKNKLKARNMFTNVGVRTLVYDHTFAFPRMACRKITVRRFGMLSRISVALMSSISSQSGAMPLTVPNTIAIPVDITVAAIPINRDCRPPYQIMEKISRPIVSVPNKNSLHGAIV